MNKHEIGALLLRVVLGITFFVHGLAKLQGGIENTAGWFSSMGLPGILAYVVTGIELIGGVALIVGLGTKIVSALLALIMLGAIVKVKIGAGFMGGYELDVVLLAIAIFLSITGSSMYSLDSKIPSKETQAQI
ncbi:DoxX family protein [Bacillus sp. Y1]|jgi:putative oxidoreductase|uniref:DoxX family protein n=1 Tax=Robertmurraya sp. TaxID=2837525 RepID=UPI000E6B4DE1|nr:DoxX family protein [Bacillus sp. Y1]AYA76228.1 DoxX family protein [Bacillus sp. Y1]